MDYKQTLDALKHSKILKYHVVAAVAQEAPKDYHFRHGYIPYCNLSTIFPKLSFCHNLPCLNILAIIPKNLKT